jgi:hypothetical protein
MHEMALVTFPRITILSLYPSVKEVNSVVFSLHPIASNINKFLNLKK